MSPEGQENVKLRSPGAITWCSRSSAIRIGSSSSILKPGSASRARTDRIGDIGVYLFADRPTPKIPNSRPRLDVRDRQPGPPGA
jgi:hypothetical protein